MANLAPIYLPQNCTPAYQLNWSVSLFGRQDLPVVDEWLGDLRSVAESDSVRILETHRRAEKVIQFLVSTRPPMAPTEIVRCLKGRLQYLIREKCPAAFRRNYRIESVGSTRADVVENYVARQLTKHRPVNSVVEERLAKSQINNPDVDLAAIRYSSHGQFIYNLHLVLVNYDRGVAVDNSQINRTSDMVLRVAKKRGLLLSRVGLLGDHLHLSLGCPIDQSPDVIALSFMNNIAFAHDMTHWFDFGYYVGTFGNYDLGAIRQHLAE